MVKLELRFNIPNIPMVTVRSCNEELERRNEIFSHVASSEQRPMFVPGLTSSCRCEDFILELHETFHSTSGGAGHSERDGRRTKNNNYIIAAFSLTSQLNISLNQLNHLEYRYWYDGNSNDQLIIRCDNITAELELLSTLYNSLIIHYVRTLHVEFTNFLI